MSETTPNSGSILRTRSLVVVGACVLLLYVGVFGVWGSTAPIAGAVVGEGTVVARGQNKLIQHLEGGIVKTIFVKEGERVKAGDKLVELEPTLPDASLQKLLIEQDSNLAREARLVAERVEGDEVTFPKVLLDKSSTDAAVKRLIVDQETEFKAKRERLKNEITVLQQKIKALQEEMAGNETQDRWVAELLTLNTQELAAVESLNQRGLAPLDRYMSLKRKYAELEGNSADYKTRIRKAKETIEEYQSQILSSRSKYVESAAIELNDVRAKISTREQEIRSALDVFDRAVIRAPVDGAVVRLKIHTPGGVISRTDVLMEVLPLPADLLVETKVKTEDIDRIRVGQSGWVRFSALDLIYMPPFEAKVEYISPDKIKDETDTTGKTYYYMTRMSQVSFPADFDKNRVTPGMPAETFILTEQRTFFGYLLRPILEGLNRSWREK